MLATYSGPSPAVTEVVLNMLPYVSDPLPIIQALPLIISYTDVEMRVVLEALRDALAQQRSLLAPVLVVLSEMANEAPGSSATEAAAREDVSVAMRTLALECLDAGFVDDVSLPHALVAIAKSIPRTAEQDLITWLHARSKLWLRAASSGLLSLCEFLPDEWDEVFWAAGQLERDDDPRESIQLSTVFASLFDDPDDFLEYKALTARVITNLKTVNRLRIELQKCIDMGSDVLAFSASSRLNPRDLFAYVLAAVLPVLESRHAVATLFLFVTAAIHNAYPYQSSSRMPEHIRRCIIAQQREQLQSSSGMGTSASQSDQFLPADATVLLYLSKSYPNSCGSCGFAKRGDPSDPLVSDANVHDPNQIEHDLRNHFTPLAILVAAPLKSCVSSAVACAIGEGTFHLSSSDSGPLSHSLCMALRPQATAFIVELSLHLVLAQPHEDTAKPRDSLHSEQDIIKTISRVLFEAQSPAWLQDVIVAIVSLLTTAVMNALTQTIAMNTNASSYDALTDPHAFKSLQQALTAHRDSIELCASCSTLLRSVLYQPQILSVLFLSNQASAARLRSVTNFLTETLSSMVDSHVDEQAPSPSQGSKAVIDYFKSLRQKDLGSPHDNGQAKPLLESVEDNSTLDDDSSDSANESEPEDALASSPTGWGQLWAARLRMRTQLKVRQARLERMLLTKWSQTNNARLLALSSLSGLLMRTEPFVPLRDVAGRMRWNWVSYGLVRDDSGSTNSSRYVDDFDRTQSTFRRDAATQSHVLLRKRLSSPILGIRVAALEMFITAALSPIHPPYDSEVEPTSGVPAQTTVEQCVEDMLHLALDNNPPTPTSYFMSTRECVGFLSLIVGLLVSHFSQAASGVDRGPEAGNGPSHYLPPLPQRLQERGLRATECVVALVDNAVTSLTASTSNISQMNELTMEAEVPMLAEHETQSHYHYGVQRATVVEYTRALLRACAAGISRLIITLRCLGAQKAQPTGFTFNDDVTLADLEFDDESDLGCSEALLNGMDPRSREFPLLRRLLLISARFEMLSAESKLLSEISNTLTNKAFQASITDLATSFLYQNAPASTDPTSVKRLITDAISRMRGIVWPNIHPTASDLIGAKLQAAASVFALIGPLLAARFIPDGNRAITPGFSQVVHTLKLDCRLMEADFEGTIANLKSASHLGQLVSAILIADRLLRLLTLRTLLRVTVLRSIARVGVEATGIAPHRIASATVDVLDTRDMMQRIRASLRVVVWKVKRTIQAACDMLSHSKAMELLINESSQDRKQPTTRKESPRPDITMLATPSDLAQAAALATAALSSSFSHGQLSVPMTTFQATTKKVMDEPDIEIAVQIRQTIRAQATKHLMWAFMYPLLEVCGEIREEAERLDVYSSGAICEIETGLLNYGSPSLMLAVGSLQHLLASCFPSNGAGIFSRLERTLAVSSLSSRVLSHLVAPLVQTRLAQGDCTKVTSEIVSHLASNPDLLRELLHFVPINASFVSQARSALHKVSLRNLLAEARDQAMSQEDGEEDASEAILDRFSLSTLSKLFASPGQDAFNHQRDYDSVATLEDLSQLVFRPMKFLCMRQQQHRGDKRMGLEDLQAWDVWAETSAATLLQDFERLIAFARTCASMVLGVHMPLSPHHPTHWNTHSYGNHPSENDISGPDNDEDTSEDDFAVGGRDISESEKETTDDEAASRRSQWILRLRRQALFADEDSEDEEELAKELKEADPHAFVSSATRRARVKRTRLLADDSGESDTDVCTDPASTMQTISDFRRHRQKQRKKKLSSKIQSGHANEQNISLSPEILRRLATWRSLAHVLDALLRRLWVHSTDTYAALTVLLAELRLHTSDQLSHQTVVSQVSNAILSREAIHDDVARYIVFSTTSAQVHERHGGAFSVLLRTLRVLQPFSYGTLICSKYDAYDRLTTTWPSLCDGAGTNESYCLVASLNSTSSVSSKRTDNDIPEDEIDALLSSSRADIEYGSEDNATKISPLTWAYRFANSTITSEVVWASKLEGVRQYLRKPGDQLSTKQRAQPLRAKQQCLLTVFPQQQKSATLNAADQLTVGVKRSLESKEAKNETKRFITHGESALAIAARLLRRRHRRHIMVHAGVRSTTLNPKMHLKIGYESVSQSIRGSSSKLDSDVVISSPLLDADCLVPMRDHYISTALLLHNTTQHHTPEFQHPSRESQCRLAGLLWEPQAFDAFVGDDGAAPPIIKLMTGGGLVPWARRDVHRATLRHLLFRDSPQAIAGAVQLIEKLLFNEQFILIEPNSRLLLPSTKVVASIAEGSASASMCTGDLGYCLDSLFKASGAYKQHVLRTRATERQGRSGSEKPRRFRSDIAHLRLLPVAYAGTLQVLPTEYVATYKASLVPPNAAFLCTRDLTSNLALVASLTFLEGTVSPSHPFSANRVENFERSTGSYDIDAVRLLYHAAVAPLGSYLPLISTCSSHGRVSRNLRFLLSNLLPGVLASASVTSANLELAPLPIPSPRFMTRKETDHSVTEGLSLHSTLARHLAAEPLAPRAFAIHLIATVISSNQKYPDLLHASLSMQLAMLRCLLFGSAARRGSLQLFPALTPLQGAIVLTLSACATILFGLGQSCTFRALGSLEQNEPTSQTSIPWLIKRSNMANPSDLSSRSTSSRLFLSADLIDGHFVRTLCHNASFFIDAIFAVLHVYTVILDPTLVDLDLSLPSNESILQTYVSPQDLGRTYELSKVDRVPRHVWLREIGAYEPGCKLSTALDPSTVAELQAAFEPLSNALLTRRSGVNDLPVESRGSDSTGERGLWRCAIFPTLYYALPVIHSAVQLISNIQLGMHDKESSQIMAAEIRLLLFRISRTIALFNILIAREQKLTETSEKPNQNQNQNAKDETEPQGRKKPEAKNDSKRKSHSVPVNDSNSNATPKISLTNEQKHCLKMAADMEELIADILRFLDREVDHTALNEEKTESQARPTYQIEASDVMQEQQPYWSRFPFHSRPSALLTDAVWTYANMREFLGLETSTGTSSSSASSLSLSVQAPSSLSSVMPAPTITKVKKRIAPTAVTTTETSTE